MKHGLLSTISGSADVGYVAGDEFERLTLRAQTGTCCIVSAAHFFSPYRLEHAARQIDDGQRGRNLLQKRRLLGRDEEAGRKMLPSEESRRQNVPRSLSGIFPGRDVLSSRAMLGAVRALSFCFCQQWEHVFLHLLSSERFAEITAGANR